MDQEMIRQALAEVDPASLQRLTHLIFRLQGTCRSSVEGPWKNKRKLGRGQEFYEHVRYAPGDDARAIDGRASARSRHLLVRRHHDEFSADWQICIDRSASMSVADGAKWSAGIQLAAAFAYILFCPPGTSQRYYLAVLKFLAGCGPATPGGGSNLANCASRLGPEASTIIISDFMAPDDMRGALSRIARRGGQVHALQITSLSDHQIPAHGPIRLRDIETGESMPFLADRQQLDAVTRRLAERQERLGSYCTDRGIRCSRCPVETSWRVNLITHLQRPWRARG
jgi:uncharacterized protein (DUF58 family)